VTVTIPHPTRLAVLQRAGYRCEDCGKAADCAEGVYPGQIDLHHVVRPEDGGTHEPENLAALCRACHRKRHRGRLKSNAPQEQPATVRLPGGAKYYSVADAARLLGRSVATVRALAPTVRGATKHGATWLIPEKELRRVKFPREGHRPPPPRLDRRETDR
jgi:hypothetical protein